MKKQLKTLIALSVFAAVSFTSIPGTNAEAKSLDELQQERKDLAKETSDAKEALKEARQKQADVEAEIRAMDNVINAAQNELDEAQADLDDVSARLEESESTLEEATAKREEQFDTFSDRMVFFYENSQLSYLDILLDAESFSDIVRRTQYIEDIMSYDSGMLDSLTATQEQISKATADIAEEKEQSEYLLKVAQDKMDELDGIIAEKESLIASYARDEAKYNELISSNEEASREAERLINQMLSQKSSTSSDFVYTGGQLNWPVPSRAPASSSLSSGYTYRKKPIGSGSELHTGYDIPAGYGSAVVAAESGSVIYAGWMRGYGNTVMIDHGGGLQTLYAHNSSLTVSVGDTVSRGDQIAKVGSTGNSTGNHCHFEVRVNGKHTSPEPYLGVPNVPY